MAEVTVCVPAYRAAAFIHHTLASIQAQSFEDFEVLVGVEPADAHGTLTACEPILADRRFQLIVNDHVLGYAGNVRALLRRVRTPLFAVLPHDDAWHPDFLERLCHALSSRPDAIGAYPDLFCFAPDGVGAGVVSPVIDGWGLPERIMSWLVNGASGNAWHALTRAAALGRAFPRNRHRDFAVECEWVLHLLGEGPLVHVGQPLYLKRQPSSASPNSVSTAWVTNDQGLPAAIDHHRRRLMALLPQDLPSDQRQAATAALEAAILRRRMEFADGRWGLTGDQLATADALLNRALPSGSDRGGAMRANVRWALSRHWDALGDAGAAERHARDGLRDAPNHPELSIQLGWLLLARDAVTDALRVGLQTSRLHPDDPHVRLLLESCEERLLQQLQPIRPAREPRSSVTERPVASTSFATAGSTGGVTLAHRMRHPRAARVDAAESRAMHAESDAESLAAQLDACGQARASRDASLTEAEVRIAILASALLGRRRWWNPLGRWFQRGRWLLVRAGAPNPLFDAFWYRTAYPDVPRSWLRAWMHWRRVGWRNGRMPNPIFDTDWYLTTNPDVKASRSDPLAHYFLHGSRECRDPSPGFDAAAYLDRYEDVRAAGMEPLLHYLRHGIAEGRTARPGLRHA